MPKENRCSFCNRPTNEVRHLIQGPGVFICDDCVRYCHEIVTETSEAVSGSTPSFLKKELPTPREIKDQLDLYVVGQEEAKRVLSVAVYNHYRRLLSKGDSTASVELEKSNIILLGPTGVGKPSWQGPWREYWTFPSPLPMPPPSPRRVMWVKTWRTYC